MVTAQEMLSFILKTVQLSQYILSQATAAASSHALKSAFRVQLPEYDRIESEIQILAARRGWELPEVQPAVLWLTGFRFRQTLGRRSPDSSIAEYLIGRHTKDMIAMLKLHNQWQQPDVQIRTLFQKLLDCKTVSIRQMHPHL